MDADQHEEVLFSSDPASGLRVIIAIHSTTLGPALGGTRFFPYETESAALADVLRLSRAMTLKAAVAGLDLGGGKAVIIGDPKTINSERLLRAYGRAVESLGGRYITAEDVGTTVEDMLTIRRETKWATGLPLEMGGSGDPSPATAYGVVAGMRAAAHHLWGSDDLDGKRVAVQGVGKVGAAMVDLLIDHGSRVTIADVNKDAVERLVAAHDVEVVAVDDVFDVACDFFAPCAMGGAVNEHTVDRLRCAAVVGSANNQLATPEAGMRLLQRGIVYAPDFVVNAGGIINITLELDAEPYSWQRAARSLDDIYTNTTKVLETAAERHIDPHTAAVAVAEERIADIGSLRMPARQDL